MPLLVDAEQIARKLGLNRRQVVDLARKGRIPVFRIGPRVLRFDELAVERSLAALEKGKEDAE